MKDSAFCLNQTLNVYLRPAERSDFSLMHVLVSLGPKNLQLLLGMRYPDKQ